MLLVEVCYELKYHILFAVDLVFIDPNFFLYTVTLYWVLNKCGSLLKLDHVVNIDLYFYL